MQTCRLTKIHRSGECEFDKWTTFVGGAAYRFELPPTPMFYPTRPILISALCSIQMARKRCCRQPSLAVGLLLTCPVSWERLCSLNVAIR